jgi:Na+/glutamate symporter
MGSSVFGAITGGLLGTVESLLGMKESRDQKELAEKQLELQRQTAQQEEQTRNKANQRKPDIDSLLQANTSSGMGSTSLTGTAGAPIDPTKLGKGNSLLGGGL